MRVTCLIYPFAALLRLLCNCDFRTGFLNMAINMLLIEYIWGVGVLGAGTRPFSGVVLSWIAILVIQKGLSQLTYSSSVCALQIHFRTLCLHIPTKDHISATQMCYKIWLNMFSGSGCSVVAPMAVPRSLRLEKTLNCPTNMFFRRKCPHIGSTSTCRFYPAGGRPFLLYYLLSSAGLYYERRGYEVNLPLISLL